MRARWNRWWVPLLAVAWQVAYAQKPKAHPLAVAGAAGDTTALQQLLATSTEDIDKPSAFGMTALHLAAARDHAESVALLLRYAASVNAENARGWTPLHLAASRGAQKAAEQLLLGGSDINTHRDNDTDSDNSV